MIKSLVVTPEKRRPLLIEFASHPGIPVPRPPAGDHRKADAPAPWPDRAGACRAIAETLNHRNDLPMVDSLRGKAARSLKNQNSIFLA